MSKEIDLIKCIIFEIDKSLYSDFGGNLCISYTPNLKKLLLALNTPEVRYYFDNQDQKIKDLEAKLAESEKKAYSRGHSQRDIANEIKLNALREDVANKEKRIVELKQQLAEKEKEISEYIKIVDDLHKQLSDKCDFCDETKDQDKISFAIEQLEKVEEILWNSQDIGNVIDNDKFLEKLNYLIKSLKGEK